MELLGNKNTKENLLTSIADLNRRMLCYPLLPDADIQNLIQLLSALIHSDDTTLLYHRETVSMILLLSEQKASMELPVLFHLVTELKCRLIRFTCLAAETKNYSSISTSETISAGTETKARERFTPTPDNRFLLPPAGEVTNLTVSEPNLDLGKTLIRDLMIDSEGYVVEERSRRYEDFYTDESEEIYNNAYLNELKLLEKEEEVAD